MPRPTLRLLLLPISYPLFVLLHLIFCVFSLLLRIYQALTTPLSSTIDIEHVPPPKHIGLVLVSTMRSAGGVRGRASGMSGKERRKREREGLVESVRRVVEWAGERDVAEVSVWDGQGLTQSVLPILLRTLSSTATLPPSPPLSPPTEPTQDTSSPSIGSFESSERPERREPIISPAHTRRPSSELMVGAGVTSVTIWPGGKGREMTIHLLPPSSSAPAMASLTRSYAAKQVPLKDITVKRVDEDMRQHLHFTNYPDLLIIHQLSPPPFYSTLLPRRAPELWGYPFWALRITEIYQHPTPTPFLHHLIPLIATLRTSAFPLIRKIGHSISIPDRPAEEVLSRNEWDGAMRAWVKVEQRLGR
ncbi:uncharacterized protein IAS62_005021 [Cryptococcus decagattii]|uniref:ditrans,polycis-polyprenyl diphosphate synthase [(2E,6E)-farnesyldiphosphate specific] n=1 Tax=Cryptococcus decagattii TaxID=1859122 RepID=A0ABZ2AYP6_9TREE